MKRRWRIILTAGGVVLGATGIALLGPFGSEPFPLADRVPADAVAYVGLPDIESIDRLPGAWTESFRDDLEEVRPFLSGAVAVYLDREREWVALARLRRASALIAGMELDGDVAVIAQSPAAFRRHRERTGTLAEDPVFRALGKRVFVNLGALDLPGRLGDFAVAGFDLEVGPSLELTGLATYRRGLRRTYLERYVHRSRAGPAGKDGCAQVLITLDPRRIFGEITAALSEDERRGTDHYLRKLSDALLGGGDFEMFLDRIGPAGGLEIHAGDPPGAVAWIDLGDGETRGFVEQMLRRCIPDIERLGTREGELSHVRVTAFEDPIWHLEFPRTAGWKLGPSFDPVCTFQGNRFVLASREDLLPAPDAVSGNAHVAIAMQVAPGLDAFRSIGKRLTKDPWIDEFAEVLRVFDRVEIDGRYAGEGLALRIRLSPK